VVSPGTRGHNPPDDDEEPAEVWLNATQAALRLGVHSNTVRNLAEAGRLPSWKMPSGVRRYPLSGVDAFLRGQEGG
jgi:excisionase family DNA binding protein